MKLKNMASIILLSMLLQPVLAENPKVDLQKLPLDGRKSAFSEALSRQSSSGHALEPIRPELTRQEIARRGEQSTGIILRKSADSAGMGTAFFIAKGIAVTNQHVVAHDGTYTLRMKTGDFKVKDYPVKILGSDKAGDVAVLKVEGAESIPALPLANPYSPPKVMDDVFIVSNPKGLEYTSVMGQISAFRMKAQLDQAPATEVLSSLKDNWDCIQYTAPIDNGSSGGAVLNNRGEVIGVNYAKGTSGQLANYASSVKNLRKLLSTLGIKM